VRWPGEGRLSAAMKAPCGGVGSPARKARIWVRRAVLKTGWLSGGRRAAGGALHACVPTRARTQGKRLGGGARLRDRPIITGTTGAN